MTIGSDFAQNFEQLKNTINYVDEYIDCCPKCGNKELSQVRASMRGTGNDDKSGLYCEKCRKMFLLK
jgi:uncharacterized protein with PIN domain